MAFKTNSELYQKMQSEHDDEIDQALGKAQEIIDYRFKDKFVLWEALQCGAERSDVWVYKFKGRSRSQHGNKRLALIGDAVLRQVFTCVMFTDGYDPGMTFADNVMEELADMLLRSSPRCHHSDVEQRKTGRGWSTIWSGCIDRQRY